MINCKVLFKWYTRVPPVGIFILAISSSEISSKYFLRARIEFPWAVIKTFSPNSIFRLDFRFKQGATRATASSFRQRRCSLPVPVPKLQAPVFRISFIILGKAVLSGRTSWRTALKMDLESPYFSPLFPSVQAFGAKCSDVHSNDNLLLNPRWSNSSRTVCCAWMARFKTDV